MNFDEERFWSKVKVSNPNDCWTWIGSFYGNGYGKFHQTISKGVYKQFCSHRVAYMISKGEIPDGMVVCHKCDEHSCVNPNHLFVGTQADNLKDMDKKSRRVTYDRSGERNPSAKLTAEDVKSIRSKYKPNIYTGRMLAEEYGVSIPLIEKILSRKVWKEVE